MTCAALLLKGPIEAADAETLKAIKVSGLLDDGIWTADIDAVAQFLKSKRCTVAIETGLETSEQLVQVLRQFFRNKATEFIVYWTGHGQRESGNWLIAEKDALSFEQLVVTWRKSGQERRSEAAGRRKQGKMQQRRLLVVADCCYSGHWTQLHERHQELDVSVQAACGSEEISFFDDAGSFLTRRLISDTGDIRKRCNQKWPAREQVSTSHSQHPQFQLNDESVKVWSSNGESRARWGPLNLYSRRAR
jgi:hypothetical protein